MIAAPLVLDRLAEARAGISDLLGAVRVRRNVIVADRARAWHMQQAAELFGGGNCGHASGSLARWNVAANFRPGLKSGARPGSEQALAAIHPHERRAASRNS